MKLIDTKDAVGTILCHDITQIIRGVTKDARFRKGHVVTEQDIPVLLSLGKEHLYVWEPVPGTVHENDAALRLLNLCKNTNMHETPVKEGKIELIADTDGLFAVHSDALIRTNSVENIIIATLHGNTAVKKGDKLAGFKVVPLAIQESLLQQAEQAAGAEPLLALYPWKIRTAAIITTGSEVYNGLIKDTFTPVLEAKLTAFGISVVFHKICTDDTKQITAAISEACKSGAGMILCTGGMSVDPDDLTPGAIKASGADIVTYGTPVMPGVMMLIGYLNVPSGLDTSSPAAWNEQLPDGVIPVIGTPGCVMYADATVFDIVLPRIAAGLRISRTDIVSLGEGGLCLACTSCRFPACSFGK